MTRRDLIRHLLTSTNLDTDLSPDEMLDLILPPPEKPAICTTHTPVASTSLVSPASYLDFVNPPRTRSATMSVADVAYAWKKYSDAENHISLQAIADDVGVSRATLTSTLRRTIGHAFDRMASRRSTGGDLYKVKANSSAYSAHVA